MAAHFLRLIMYLIMITIRPIHIITSPNISINTIPHVPIVKIAHTLNTSNRINNTVNNIISLHHPFIIRNVNIAQEERALVRTPLLLKIVFFRYTVPSFNLVNFFPNVFQHSYDFILHPQNKNPHNQ